MVRLDRYKHIPSYIYTHTHIHIYIHINITHIYTGANTKSGWCNVVPRFRDIKIALTG